jgi:NitT/TauT family transport system substrate-binding protein
MIGYVFDERWAAKNSDVLARFLAMTREAKEILARSDAEWDRIAPLVGAADSATLKVFRDRYREGIPRRPLADEQADAEVLYHVLARLGGAELVGPGSTLAPGTFYSAPSGN